MPHHYSILACATDRLKSKRDRSFVTYRPAGFADPAAIERLDLDHFTRVVRSELDRYTDDLAGLNADRV